MDEKCYLCGSHYDEYDECQCPDVPPTCDTENPEECEACQ
jgi:hypothetical protein